jgi:hypothetical protein
MANHSSAQGSRPEISFGPAFRLKVSIDKLRGRSRWSRALQSVKTARAAEPRDELPRHLLDHLVGADEQM